MDKNNLITSNYNPIDNNGNKVHAHSGSIIRVNNIWYWFGEKPRYGSLKIKRGHSSTKGIMFFKYGSLAIDVISM